MMRRVLVDYAQSHRSAKGKASTRIPGRVRSGFEGRSNSWANLLLANLLISKEREMGIYQNQRSRRNWGIAGGQVPLITGGFSRNIATIDGEPALIRRNAATMANRS
jgi:hypothetical protein